MLPAFPWNHKNVVLLGDGINHPCRFTPSEVVKTTFSYSMLMSSGFLSSLRSGKNMNCLSSKLHRRSMIQIVTMDIVINTRPIDTCVITALCVIGLYMNDRLYLLFEPRVRLNLIIDCKNLSIYSARKKPFM